MVEWHVNAGENAKEINFYVRGDAIEQFKRMGLLKINGTSDPVKTET